MPREAQSYFAKNQHKEFLERGKNTSLVTFDKVTNFRP